MVPRKGKTKTPKIDKGKTDNVRLRCTPAQKTMMERAAQKTGLSLSSWLLSLGIREAEKAEGGAGS
jgi:uncharacterized protein (DUF1778 family)